MILEVILLKYCRLQRICRSSVAVSFGIEHEACYLRVSLDTLWRKPPAWRWTNCGVVVTTRCPTCYRTRHFFNNSNTNEDIATRFEQEYVRCVRNEEECVCSVCLFRCNICIGAKIIKEMPGWVASGTLCICPAWFSIEKTLHRVHIVYLTVPMIPGSFFCGATAASRA
jgi:hypothetical protein